MAGGGVNSLVKFVLFAFFGVSAGYLSALYMADGARLAGAAHAGAWVIWPDSGSSAASPYSRLHYLLKEQLPPSHFDRLEFEASRDDAGRSLVSSCLYRLEGPMPKMRWWALSAYPANTADGDAAVKVGEISSHDVIYEPDGHLRISLASRAQPGNWLPMPAQGNVVLVLRLFNAGPAARDQLHNAPLRIIREACL